MFGTLTGIEAECSFGDTVVDGFGFYFETTAKNLPAFLKNGRLVGYFFPSHLSLRPTI